MDMSTTSTLASPPSLHSVVAGKTEGIVDAVPAPVGTESAEEQDGQEDDIEVPAETSKAAMDIEHLEGESLQARLYASSKLMPGPDASAQRSTALDKYSQDVHSLVGVPPPPLLYSLIIDS